MGVNILIVDDEPKILEIVQSYLTKNNYQPFMAQTGQEALEIFDREKISLVVLDLMLPDLSGEQICREIRKKSAVPVIIMTAKVDEESIVHGLNIGADDYVTKPFSPRQLMARIAAVLRRTSASRSLPELLEYRNLVINLNNKSVTKDSARLSLTPSEYGILSLLMGRPCKIFTREEIISQIMEHGYDGYDRTIDAHIKNLRQKIEDDPKKPEFIRTIYGMGYRFGKEEL